MGLIVERGIDTVPSQEGKTDLLQGGTEGFGKARFVSRVTVQERA